LRERQHSSLAHESHAIVSSYNVRLTAAYGFLHARHDGWSRIASVANRLDKCHIFLKAANKVAEQRNSWADASVEQAMRSGERNHGGSDHHVG
jgi:hypothetical protein